MEREMGKPSQVPPLTPIRDQQGSPPRKKQKKSPAVSPSLPKHPVMALNEIKPNLVYDIVESGPAHARVYTASVTINGQVYRAEDVTKKKAKAKVAEMILQCSLQLKDPTVKYPHQRQSSICEDFSQDPTEGILDSEDFFTHETAVLETIKSTANLTPEFINQKVADQVVRGQTNPVFNLNLLRPGLKYEFKEEGESHAKKFTAIVWVDDVIYEGVGSSKKAAKNEAAYNALSKGLSKQIPLSFKTANKLDGSNFVGVNSNPAEADRSDFGDYIAQLIESTYQTIMKDAESSVARYKVLAGIVMSRGSTADGTQVISIATGSKCINGGQLNLEGEALNDCHAEILARRGLVSFLYDKLDNYATDPDSIFEPAHNKDQLPPRLKLKSDVLFHLYVSSAPCGDARIFTLNDTSTTSLEDPHPNRQGRGALRTKIESGEGTVPVNDSPIQTWDGILQGERLLTMSCSDKVLRWNVVGVQGSLLSHLVNPIYFHMVVVGSLYHPVHLRRALIGRIGHLQGLPSPFILSRPVLAATSSPQERLPAKSPKHSVCWALGWPQHEMIEITKGKCLDGTLSRLCKRSFFQRFTSLVTTRREWLPVVQPHVQHGRITYKNVKKAAQGFEEAKEMLQSSLIVARLGQWVKKPLEQDGFEIYFENDRLVAAEVVDAPALSSSTTPSFDPLSL